MVEIVVVDVGLFVGDVGLVIVVVWIAVVVTAFGGRGPSHRDGN